MMPVSSATAGVAASLMPLLDYFRPTKSPYLLVVLVGVGGIIFLDYWFEFSEFSEENIDTDYWYYASVPIALVLVVLTVFTFLHQMEPNDDDSERDIESQLKFSRSICISSAMLCLVVGVLKFSNDKNTVLFSIHFLSCIWQLGVFVVYSAARLRQEEPASSLNHFQISLVTSSYLIALTICLFMMNVDKPDSSIATVDVSTSDGTETVLDFYFASVVAFWSLWASCQVYWTRRLRRIISISVRVRNV